MKILLVEDARTIVAVMTARLVALGHDVIHAGDGRTAINLFRESAPDLVLMDIEMPVMNGFEATNRIRAIESTRQWAWTPIIFLTASDTVENLVTAIEAGGDDFMAKAVPEPVLKAKMKAMARIATLRQDLSAANRKLEELATRDGLTGLCNRRHLDTLLEIVWVDALREGSAFALLMLDIDNFKKYNDHYGHQQGDDCLRAVARALAAAVDRANAEGIVAGAFAARYGGEEFAVVVPKATAAGYEGLAAAVVNAVRGLRLEHAKNADWGIVTVSVGGTLLASAAGEIGAAFRSADERLYRAKERGRNRAELA